MRTFRGLRSMKTRDELVEQEVGVDRARGRFWMELHAQERALAVPYAFVRAVVEILEPRRPAGGQRPLVHGIAMVLGRDVAARRAHHGARLVLAAVSELELVGVGAGSERQDLVTEADAEDGALLLHHSPH